MDPKFIVVARFYLDSGTQSFSNLPVTHPTWTYEARVLRWGYIERSISIPISLPRIGDAVIRIADTDRQFRDLLSVEPSRRRLVEIKIVEQETSESAVDPIYRGAVTNTTFGPGYCEISIRDMVNTWIDEELPSVINRVNYPNLAEGIDNAFLPIVNGEVISSDDNPQGVIELPHIGYDGANSPPDFIDRWGAAIHPIEDIAIYRQLPGENFYSPVNPDEYDVTQESKVFAELPTLTATPTYVDFIVPQPDGTKIRADIWGINYRGPWNGIAEAASFQENRNPINFFINMIYLAMAKAGADSSVWEISTIQDTLDKFYTILDDSPPTGFLCDGAITRAMTVREWLGVFLSDFEIDFYQQKNGKLAIAYVQDTDPSRPLFTAGHDVEINSFFEEIAKPTVNQCRYHFAKNYASNEYGINSIYNNFIDQGLLGTVSSPPQSIVEAEDFQMDYVRDPATAIFVIRRRMSFLSLGSFRQTWNMDLANTIEDLELARLIGLTHFDGLDVGGYVNAEVKVLGLTIDLDKMKVAVSSILRVPRLMGPDVARPTIYSAITEPAPNSTITGPDLANDNDAQIGESLTYTELAISGTGTFTEYVYEHWGGFPESDPAKTLDRVRIWARLEYITGGGAAGSPIATVGVFRIGDANPTHHGDEILTINNADTPVGDFYFEYTAAEFAAAFPGGMSECVVRAVQYHTLSQGTWSPEFLLRIYDIWRECIYV